MAKDFGRTLAEKRKHKNLSQPELASILKEKGIDVKAPSISKWEKNINTPNVHQFFALCEILDISDINETFGIAERETLYNRLSFEGKRKVFEYMDLLLRGGLYDKTEGDEYVWDRFKQARIYPEDCPAQKNELPNDSVNDAE